MDQKKDREFGFIKKEHSLRIERAVQKNAVARFLTNHVALAFCYGIFLFLYEIAFLRETIPVIHPVLIGWAGCLAVYDIVVRRMWEKLPLWQPLLIFALLAGITSLVNRETGLAANLKTWVMAVLPLVAFLPLCLMCEKEQREISMLTALSGGMVITFLASVLALVLYLMRVSISVELWGATHMVGFRYHLPDDPHSGVLLYGIYSDTNHAAAYSIISAVYSLWLLDACRRGKLNKLVKVLAMVNLAVQLCYFPLANSRGGWLGLIVAGAVCVFLYAFCTRVKTGNKLKKAVFAVIAAAVCMAVVCGGMILLRSGVSLLSKTIEYLPTLVPSAPAAPGTSVTVPGETIPGETIPGESTAAPVKPTAPSWQEQDTFAKADSNLGSGRMTIWKEALQIYRKHAIWGIGQNNSAYYAKMYGIGEKLPRGSSMHNSFLDLLVGYGALGFLAMLGFFVGCAWIVLRRFFTKGSEVENTTHLSAFCVVFLAGISMFLSCTFVNTTAMNFLLMCFMGFLVAQCNDKDVKE